VDVLFGPEVAEVDHARVLVGDSLADSALKSFGEGVVKLLGINGLCQNGQLKKSSKSGYNRISKNFSNAESGYNRILKFSRALNWSSKNHSPSPANSKKSFWSIWRFKRVPLLKSTPTLTTGWSVSETQMLPSSNAS
jgi:hypothetical protein